MNANKVLIIGAGPGDVELLTIKAYNCIKNAEVILYDNLVSEDILRLNTEANKVYAGRKYGDISNQTGRNTLINYWDNTGDKEKRWFGLNPAICIFMGVLQRKPATCFRGISLLR